MDDDLSFKVLTPRAVLSLVYSHSAKYTHTHIHTCATVPCSVVRGRARARVEGGGRIEQLQITVRELLRSQHFTSHFSTSRLSVDCSQHQILQATSDVLLGSGSTEGRCPTITCCARQGNTVLSSKFWCSVIIHPTFPDEYFISSLARGKKDASSVMEWGWCDGWLVHSINHTREPHSTYQVLVREIFIAQNYSNVYNELLSCAKKVVTKTVMPNTL